MLPILSHYQTSPLLAAREQELTSSTTSIDLGMTSIDVSLTSDRVIFPDSSFLDWQFIEKINSNKNACFYLKDNTATPLRGFSETLGRAYSLMPTSGAPVLVAAGFPMHRSKNITPSSAAMAMVEPIMPIGGTALDTATGLGYTAIVASKTASMVFTIERCPVTQKLARMNPWSQSLFNNPKSRSSETVTRKSQNSVTTHLPPSFMTLRPWRLPGTFIQGLSTGRRSGFYARAAGCSIISAILTALRGQKSPEAR
jgi:predicted methyltransferase